VSLETAQIRIDARSATFALSTSLASGDLLSVLKGQVKVRNPDKSVIFVNAGKSLRTGIGIYPKLGLLDDQQESLEHKQGLALLSNNPLANPVPSDTPGTVGTGAETPFDLQSRRRAALLTAPNEPNIGRPDVSPELPNSLQSAP
jgi:hypothetical protein